MNKNLQPVSITNYFGVKSSAVFMLRTVLGEVWTIWMNFGIITLCHLYGDGCVTGGRPGLQTRVCGTNTVVDRFDSYTSPPTYLNHNLNYKSSIPPPLKYRLVYDEQSK